MNHGIATKPPQILLLTLLVATFISSCKRDSQTEEPDSPKQLTTNKGDFLTFMHEGHAAAARWDQPGATTAFRKALDADPTSTPARLNLGLAQLLDSKPEDAVATLKPLLDRPPVSTQLEYLYGLSLLKAGKPEDAIEHLRKASNAAPHESSVLFQYGVATQESKKSDEAATVFRKVIDLDRFHITAPFRLARIERVAGRTEEADRWMLKSEQNRAILGTDASDREARGLNRFTKPLDPPLGWEPKESAPTIRYSDQTKALLPDSLPLILHSPIAIADLGHDGSTELIAMGDNLWRIFGFDNGVLKERIFAVSSKTIDGALVVNPADFDNDGFQDFFFAGMPQSLFLRQLPNLSFIDATVQAGLSGISAFDSLPIDIDVDGDLDLLVSREGESIQLYQNQGNATFVDATLLLRLPHDWIENPTGPVSVDSIGDVNDDDSIDVLVSGGLVGHVWFNRGSYDLGSLPSLEIDSNNLSRLDDINNDGQLEAAYVNYDGPSSATGYVAFTDQSIKRIRFDGLQVVLIKLLDFDSDGFLDVLLWGQGRFQLWRNRGALGWHNATAITGLDSIKQTETNAPLPKRVDVCDFDMDGDFDLIEEIIGGETRFIRAECNKNPNVLRLSLEGTKSNRSGIGARVDIRAGSARIFRNITSQPISIGVGDFEKLDLVKILWPNGATDAFTNVPVDKPLHVVETTVTLGSCPHLYVWDNDQFRFVTDILGNAPLGLPYAPGKYLAADTSEIVWLGDETNVQTKEVTTKAQRHEDLDENVGDRIPEGKADAPVTGDSPIRHSTFDIRHSSGPVTRAPGSEESQRLVTIEITDELRELLYLDEVKLLVVDHPRDVEVHPNDKVIPPPFPNSEVWSVRNARPPIHAVDDAGQDVAEKLSRIDNVRAGPRKLRQPQFKGLAEITSITLDFGPIDTTQPNTLVLNGWLHWGGASSNIAAAQNPALGNPFPRLDAMTADGTWQPVDVIVGAPSGKTKTILVDLTNKLPAETKQLRLTWSLEVFWDRIALAERVDNPLVTEIPLASANLYYRGVPRMTRSSPDQPFIPDYNDLLESPPWRNIPEGFCTRFGDVLELLTATDDRYVIMNCGDACRIEFDVTALPSVADGWSRDFFLYTDGWDKDMDHNVFTGHTVLPLPVHGQDEQSYGLKQSELPTTDWIEKYNTRWVPAEFND